MPEIDVTTPETDQIEIDIKPEEPKGESHEVGVTSSFVAADQGRDPVKEYDRTTASQELESIVDTTNTITEEDRLGIMGVLVGVSGKEDINKEASDFVKDTTGQSGVLGQYIQKIKSMPSSVGQSEETIKQLALLTYTREALGQFSSSGIGETISDIGGVVLPLRKGEAVVDVAKRLGFVDGIISKASIAAFPESTLDQLRNIGLSLTTPEDKANYLDVIGQVVDKSSDNNIIKSIIMDSVFSAEPSSVIRGLDLLDPLFVAQITTSVLKAVSSTTKLASGLNSLRKVEGFDAIADVVRNAPKSPEFAAKTGTSPANSADAVNPLIRDEIGEAVQGASEGFQANVVHLLDMQDARIANLVKTTEREGVLTAERSAEVMREAEIAQMKIKGVVEAKVVKSDETGFTLQWGEELFDEAGKSFSKKRVKIQTKQVDFRLKDNKGVEAPLNEYDSFLKSDPNATMTGKLRNWFVTTVEKLSNQQARTASTIDKSLRDAFSGLKKGKSGKDPVKVDYALMQGAKEGKLYSFEDLTDIGVGANSVRLSEVEAQAYYGARNVVGQMYDLKNKQIVDSFLATGVKLVDAFGGVVPAKSFDDVASALKGWKETSSDSRWINIADDGLKQGDVPVSLLKFKRKDELTEEILEEAYKEGYVLVKNSSQSVFLKRGNNTTQWGLVRKEFVKSPRGQQVINKIPGYMPKQRTNGYYFIKSSKPGVLSGADKNFRTGQTVAWADSSKSADEWIALQDNPKDFIRLFDRELPPEQSITEIAATHGGMYFGKRKATELPYVGDQKAEFAGSFEAMQHYINHIGRQYPASLYRLGSEQRLLEIAKNLGVKNARSVQDVLAKAEASGLATSSKSYKLIESLQNQVKFINMIPTSSEQAWAKRWETVANALDKRLPIPGWDKVPKFFYNKAQASTHPADLMRGITFNHLLGMYNPAQILVQASGAMVSFAVAPLQFTKALPKAVGWSMLDNMIADPIAQAKAMKWMRKNKLGEYADSYELWAKSGYRENIVNSNADYTSVFMKNLPYDANILQKAVSNHTVFYKMGELANTRMAFGTALEEYRAANKISKLDFENPKVLEAIRERAEILRLNMSRANQAWFNKGAVSVPLQFQQVITKYFEKVLPKSFGGTNELTSLEKFRLASIPTTIVGLSGVALAENVSIELMRAMGIDAQELSPEETTMIKFGAIGWMMNEALDINVDISTRTTLAANIPQKVWESLTQQKATWQWLGATGSVTERYFRNAQFAAEAFDLSVIRNEEVDLDAMKFMASVLVDAASDIPTLSRNYKQYSSFFWTQNKQFIRNGQYQFDLETMNDRTALFAIAGIQPTEISEIYQIDKELNDGRAALNAFGDTDVSLITRILNLNVLNSSVSVREQQLGSLMVNSILQKYGIIEAQEILKGVWDKTYSKRFEQGNLLWKLLLDSESKIDGGQEFLSTIAARARQPDREKK